MLLPVCILLIILLGLTISLALAEAAGKDKYKDSFIEKKIELAEMWKYCDQDCYMCDLQYDCKKSAMKDVR